MDRLIKLPALVAVFAALALAGMVGIFAFNAAQPAQAQEADEPDTMAPMLNTVEIADNTTVVLTYNETLDGGSTPDEDDFEIMAYANTDGDDDFDGKPPDDVRGHEVSLGNRNVSNVAITGATVRLTLATGIDIDTTTAPDLAAHSISLMYTAGDNPIQDEAENAAMDENIMADYLRIPGMVTGLMIARGATDVGADSTADTEDDTITLTLSWMAPVYTGDQGLDATNPYQFRYRIDNDNDNFTETGEADWANTAGTDAEHTIATLIAATSYVFEVRAVNAGGTPAVDSGPAAMRSTGPTPEAVDSVDARPKDPGAAAQITVEFNNPTDLMPDDSITIEVDDNTGVPGSISASHVSISGFSGGDAVAAAPRSVIVEEDSRAERYKITLFIADMDTSDSSTGPDGLDMGKVTVTIRQNAGITNRTEGGSDDWFVSTSEDSMEIELGGYTVPFLVELSSYGDARGEDITVVGKGFKNGTTVRFWRDSMNMGMVDSDEVVLCSAIASGDDIAECTFTVSNPPFMSGTEGNYINAIDGRNNRANDGGTKSTNSDLPTFELEPSMSASPKEGSPGDSVNIQLYDFVEGDTVNKIDFGRRFIHCDNTDAGTGNDCPSSWGAVGPDGGLSFSFDIRNGVTPGVQQMRIFAGQGTTADDMTARDVDTNFLVGLGQLEVSSTDVLPNQRISITGSGFTNSQGQAAAYIGDLADIPNNSACSATYGGAVSLGGDNIGWDRVNDGEAIEVTSGGGWSAAIDLPVNSLTTVASTRELKVIDCMGGVAVVDLTFPAREVTMTPAEGRVGSEVVISGKNFPAANGDSDSDVEIEVVYDATLDSDDADTDPDALGNFTVILEVPEDATIPSTNTVTVQFTDDDNVKVTETRTHRVPQGTVTFSADSGAEGSLLTIKAEGFARYTSVDEVLFGDNEITPAPKPSTSTTGDAEFQVRIPGADPGIYIIKVVIDDVTATQTFTVVSGAGVVDGSVETILANVISEDALDRVFKFDNMTKEWLWYINDPAFASTNNLAGLSSGDLVWIKVTKSVTADVLGTDLTLTCINEGMENEDCWNQVSIP